MPTATIGQNSADILIGFVDTKIKENAATTNYATDFLEVNKYAAADWSRTLVKATGISSLPVGAIITAVSLSMRVNGGAGADGTYTMAAKRVLRNWVDTQATWNVWATASNWTTAGATGSGSDIAASATFTSAGLGIAAGYITLTGDATAVSDVQAMLAGSMSNYGWLIDRTDGSNDFAYRNIDSSEAGDGSRPYLTVTYTTTSGVTLTSVNTTSAYRISSVADLAVGDQIEVRGVGGGSPPAGLTVNPDATWYFTAGNPAVNFEARVYDVGDSSWGAWALQTIALPLLVGTGARVSVTTSKSETPQEVVADPPRSARWLPTSRQPIAYTLDKAGKRVPVYIDEHWYRFFDEVAQRRLGGVDGPALPDVQANADSAVAAVAAVETVATTAQQTADATVQGLAQTKDVLVTADVPGADQIEIPFFGF